MPTDDGGFLAATYEAGQQGLRSNQPRCSGSGSGAGKDGDDGKESKGAYCRSQADRNDRRSQAGRSQALEPTEGQRWKAPFLALRGGPQAEIKAHKDAEAQCWRCGSDSHHTLFWYAKRAKGGVDLPEAPLVIAGTSSGKRSNPRLG